MYSQNPLRTESLHFALFPSSTSLPLILVFCIASNTALAIFYNIDIAIVIRRILTKMYTSRAVAVIVTSVVLPLLASIAIALRFKARNGKAVGFHSDDYFIVAALVSSLKVMNRDVVLKLFQLITIVGSAVYIDGAVRDGIGAHIETLDPSQLVSNGKVNLSRYPSSSCRLNRADPVCAAILLHWFRRVGQNLRLAILQAHLHHARLSDCCKCHGRGRGGMAGCLLLRDVVPSLAT